MHRWGGGGQLDKPPHPETLKHVPLCDLGFSVYYRGIKPNKLVLEYISEASEV